MDTEPADVREATDGQQLVVVHKTHHATSGLPEGQALRGAKLAARALPHVTSVDELSFAPRHSGLLETPGRAGVWRDSVQVPGGTLSIGLPTRLRVWLTIGLQPVGRRW